jgi:cytochrome c peroxidase
MQRAMRLIGAAMVAVAGAATVADTAMAATVADTAMAASVAGIRASSMFSADEVSLILQHGPWPPRATPDPSNRVAGSAAAARFGAQLFFDPRLSTSGTIACATCHVPELGWSDGRPTARGLGDTDRNSRSVMDTRFNRWFGWAGATDSLWAASLRPLADPLEMGRADRHVPALVREQPDLACNYRQVFGHAPSATDDDRVLTDVGKVLAAFQAKLVSGRTPFDDFRDALARGDRRAQARYPETAQRGLKLFVGRAQCNLCHLGPQFSNGEFDKVGISVRRPDGRIDWGRYDGIKALQANRFSLMGRFNDDQKRADGQSTRLVALTRENYGQFRVPGLRNVGRSAPYMHDGSLPTLTDVVRHYSTIDAVKLHLAMPHAHGDPGEDTPPPPTVTFPRTLDLTEAEIADLVAFLGTLSERRSRLFTRPAPLPACS